MDEHVRCMRARCMLAHGRVCVHLLALQRTLQRGRERGSRNKRMRAHVCKCARAGTCIQQQR
eukprot:122066-Karenia_brevis.AAC.1